MDTLRTKLIILICSIFGSLFGQTPSQINYQSVIRDTAGNIISAQNISMRLSILEGSTSGTLVFQETHSQTTNTYGLVNLSIGSGINLLGNLSNLLWDRNTFYLKTELDIYGGSDFIPMGITQLVSVPYAFEAKHASSLTLTDANGRQYEASIDTNGVLIFIPEWLCGDSLIDDRDDQQYGTISIGSQCWMSENLNIGLRIDGTINQTDNEILEKYCYYNINSNCLVYGGLYQWGEAMQYDEVENSQGICPIGWHVPSDHEWKLLEGSVDSQYSVGDPIWDFTGLRGLDVGSKLKSVNGWANNGNGTDDFGYSVLPGGLHSSNGFIKLGEYARFWTSTKYPPFYQSIYFRNFESGQSKSERSISDGYSHSIRCLKNCSPLPSESNAGPDQFNIPGNTTILQGNTPIIGDGIWAVISGNGGVIYNPNDPSSVFTGLSNVIYKLKWTISNNCSTNYDWVEIHFE